MPRREYRGALVGLAGIACNAALAAAKIAMGLSVNSAAVLSDAFNNLTDAAASLVLTAGFLVAGKTPDREHPFGHGRMEYVSGLVVACLIMATGLGMAKFSLERLWHPQSVAASRIVLWGLGLGIVVKLLMGLFYYRANATLRSQAIRAGITDSFSDAAVTAVVLSSFFLEGLAPFSLDAAIGFVVAGIIFCGGFKSAREDLTSILGKAGDDELMRRIREVVLAVDGVTGVHDLTVHDYGPSRKYASAHIECIPSMKFSEVHEALEKATDAARRILSLDLVLLPEPTDKGERHAGAQNKL
ncbi:MAG: cation diffusion facilitator family transporter [Desulfovibrio sp.]|nr:cation diffusion facilitator family transporter [Desulfovibrio sp.]